MEEFTGPLWPPTDAVVVAVTPDCYSYRLDNGNWVWIDSQGWAHREDGPAIEAADGSRYWYRHGRPHREGGPAYELADGRREWWINNAHHRLDGPAIEHPDGNERWLLNGRKHREDGPAISWPSGTRHWYQHDLRHREDGPAVEWADGGCVAWWLEGRQFSEQEWQDEIQARTYSAVVVRPGERSRLSGLAG